jgi:hypothetical protein
MADDGHGVAAGLEVVEHAMNLKFRDEWAFWAGSPHLAMPWLWAIGEKTTWPRQPIRRRSGMSRHNLRVPIVPKRRYR